MRARAASAPRFFASPSRFRAWLEAHHADATELSVGFHKRDSGKPSITWPQSVDEALCFGWIDGVRHRIDETSYRIRFTPRRETSVWSTVNIRRARELIEAGRMRPAGLRAFERRKENLTRRYSFEQGEVKLAAPYERQMRARATAWKFFRAQPPWYQRTATWYVMSAKKEETRQRRLERLILDSENQRLIGPMTSKKT